MMHYQGQLPVDQNDPESEPAPSIVSSADHRRPPPPWYAAPPPIIDPARLEELHSKLDILMRTNQWLVDEILAQRGDIRNLTDQCDELRKTVNSLGFRDSKPTSSVHTRRHQVAVGTQCDDLPTEEEKALRSELLRAKLELNEKERLETRRRPHTVCRDVGAQTMERITPNNRIVLSDDVMWWTPGGLYKVGKYSVTSTTWPAGPDKAAATYGYNAQTPSSFYDSTCLPTTEGSFGGYQYGAGVDDDGAPYWESAQGEYEFAEEESFLCGAIAQQYIPQLDH